jgi:hypothetical protein
VEGFLFGDEMSVKLGNLVVDVSISLRKVILTDGADTVYEVLCKTCLAGRKNLPVSSDDTASTAGNETVIGKIVIAKGTIRHEEIIAATLATMSSKLRTFCGDIRIGHVGTPSTSVA